MGIVRTLQPLAIRSDPNIKHVLVAGGAGGVGEGIVRALLRAGYSVLVPSRSLDNLETLRARLEAGSINCGSLKTLVGNVGDVDGASEIRDRIVREFGYIDAAIASLGGWWQGAKLTELSPAVWDAVMNEMLRTHFVFARVFVPMLLSQGGGRFIGIGGGAAYFPIPSSALVSIAAAAQLMLTRALRAEALDTPHVDILELVVDGPVRTRDSGDDAGPDWISADDVGSIAIDLVARGRTDAPSTHADGAIVRMRPRSGNANRTAQTRSTT